MIGDMPQKLYGTNETDGNLYYIDALCSATEVVFGYVDTDTEPT